MNRILFIVFFLCFLFKLNSQGLYGGEIEVQNIGGLNYQALISLSLDNGINPATRPYVVLDWGDGSSQDTLLATNTTCSSTVAYTIKYSKSHLYPAPSNYTLSCTGGYFSGSISNLPNPINKSLILEYNLLLNAISGVSTSPNSASCLTNTFTTFQNTFNQNAVDNDGDSLSYSLYSPPFPGFSISGFTLDAQSGLISHTNSNTGTYLVPVKVQEWRKISNTNYLIGVSIRYHSLIYYSSTGWDKISKSQGIKIYPNPTNSFLHISDEQNELSSSDLSITNSLGQTVLEIPFQQSIDVSTLPEGCYMITVTTKQNQQLRSKFVKY